MSAIKALLGGPASQSSPSKRPLRRHTPPLPRLLTPSPAPLQSTPTTPEPPRAPGKATPPQLAPAPALRPKPKIVKDAPVFTPSLPRGPLRYPPQEATTEASEGSTSTSSSTSSDAPLAAYHEHFSVYPLATDIGLYPRHIPYNSEKRVFVNATGRDFFEVFQYTFRVPDAAAAGVQQEGKTYTMLWDYNTGLVRTTPLFKCCGYGKTTPAKMLNKNVGLKDICHSITGGALVAQGYWIPYSAAKAIAATFCYSIRHALTPVFGVDFIDLCVEPHDARFGSMLIDEAITAQCRAKAAEYFEYELQNPTVRPTTGPGSRSASPRTTPPSRYIQPMRLPGLGIEPEESSPSTGGATSSPCESEISEPDDQYVMSPTGPTASSPAVSPRFRNVWTHANVPRSTPRIDDEEVHSPKSIMKSFHARGKSKRNFADFVENRSAYSSPGQSPKMRKVGWGKAVAFRMEGQGDLDGGYDADADEMDVDGAGWGRKYQGDGKGGYQFGDNEAAKALLALGEPRKVTGRRASA